MVAAGASAPLTFQGSENTPGAFTLDSNAVTVQEAGTYLVMYGVITTDFTPLYGAFVNGTLCPESIAGFQPTTGSCLTVLSVGDQIIVKNLGTSSDLLSFSIGDVVLNPVTLTLLKVGE